PAVRRHPRRGRGGRVVHVARRRNDERRSPGDRIGGCTMNTRSLLPRGWTRHPFEAIPRAVHKLTIGRWRYQRGADYAARDYWNDRLAHFGDSLRGPGWEGMSEQANEEAYAEKAAV